MKEALVYLLVIAIAEVINVTIGPVWGIVCHIIVLVALILRSALADKRAYQQLPLSLALVPLVRIISLSMPLANIPPIWWYPIIYAPLLVAAWQVVRLQGYSLGQIGLNLKRVPIQLAVALTGTVFGIGEYFILTEEAQMTGLMLQQTWLLSAFLLIVSTGLVEEVIFRGVIQRSAVQVFGWWGVIYVSVLFAVVHLIHHSLLDIGFVFVVGLFYGWVVKKTGSLFGVVLSHGITNVVLFLVAPLLF
jgi:membrane protease YdiL (CAAX protease family)